METVKSADGTVIAYDRTGDGPVLIVCVGAFCTRHTFAVPAELARQFTVVTYDRRGRGDSGDTEPFAAGRGHDHAAPPAPGPDPDQEIRGRVDAGRNRDAVIFWMRDVVRLPEQAVAGMSEAP